MLYNLVKLKQIILGILFRTGFLLLYCIIYWDGKKDEHF